MTAPEVTLAMHLLVQASAFRHAGRATGHGAGSEK